MHHPVSFGAFPGAATIVNQRLLEANAAVRLFRRVNWLVDARRLPKPGSRHPIWPHAVPVFPSSNAKEVPLFVPNITNFYKAMRQ